MSMNSSPSVLHVVEPKAPSSACNTKWPLGRCEYGFYFGFIKNTEGIDSIMVVVDLFYKMAHFIPCYKSDDHSHIAFFFISRKSSSYIEG